MGQWVILSSGTHIFVIDTFHKHQLPVCSLGVSLVLKGSAEFLNGHISVQDGVISSTARERERETNINVWNTIGASQVADFCTILSCVV